MKKKNFGTTIKILRITYGLSQCELGRLSGIGPAAIVKIECGQKVRLNSYQIGELASILCCNREYLLDLYGWKPGDDSVSAGFSAACGIISFPGSPTLYPFRSRFSRYRLTCPR